MIRTMQCAEWATFGKQNWRCGMNRTDGVSAPDETLIRAQKRCRSVETAGRWPWKSAAAKECVTTHLPNRSALKTDGAGASGPCPPVRPMTDRRRSSLDGETGERVGGHADGRRRSDASPAGAVGAADLGGSSKHSSESLSKAEAEQGSRRPWIDRGLAAPKQDGEGHFMQGPFHSFGPLPAKGSRASIPGPRAEICPSSRTGQAATHCQTRRRRPGPREELSFLGKAAW